MVEHLLCFPSTSADTGAFRLLELPPDLAAVVEDALKASKAREDELESSDNAKPPRTSLKLQIKGVPGDDAVVCTEDRTFAMRAVVLSNSVLVVSRAPPPLGENGLMNVDGGNGNTDDDNTVVIRDTVNEVLELVPAVPRLHALLGRLRGQEYGEENEDEDTASTDDGLTYAEARSAIQASNAELDRGLRDRRVLVLNGRLRPIASALLRTILELLLNLLAAQGYSTTTTTPVRAEELISALADEHEVARAVSTQVMAWFGEVDEREDRWEPDAQAIVREIGLSMLKAHQHEPIRRTRFMTEWRRLVGDAFEAAIKMDLLAGNYLSTVSSLSYPANNLNGGADDPDQYSGGDATITYFPAFRLPVDPAARFGDLFLTQARWSHDEIMPFLSDIAVDGKERDRLLLKYARATTDMGYVSYTARAQYNG